MFMAIMRMFDIKYQNLLASRTCSISSLRQISLRMVKIIDLGFEFLSGVKS